MIAGLSSGRGRLPAWLRLTWTAPAGPGRLALFRIAVGGYVTVYLLARLPRLWADAGRDPDTFFPVGVTSMLSGPVAPGLARLLLVLAVVGGALVTAGWRYRIVAPAAAALVWWVLTYRNSFGSVLHTDNLAVLHLALLALVPAAEARSLDARRRGGSAGPPPSPAYRWPLALAALLTTLPYVVAAVAKFRLAGLDWLDGEVLRTHVALDNLRKDALGDPSSPVGEWLVRRAWPWPALVAVALAVEVGAPLAVLGRRLRLVVPAALWCFHVGILVVMAILFPYHLVGVAFLPMLLLGERASARVPPNEPENGSRTGIAVGSSR